MKPRREHWVAIDLDQTFLFRDSPPEGTTVATLRDGEPSSRIADDALLLLQALSKEFTIVPLTSRGANSFQKINLEGVPIEIVGVDHGAQLLVDGEPDPEWTRQMQLALEQWQKPLAELSTSLELGPCRGTETRLVQVEGVGSAYFRAKFSDAEAALVVQNEIAEDPTCSGCEITVALNQLHITPKPATKGALADYLAITYFSGKPPTIAFGDSGADLGALARSRFASTPVGSQLWNRIDG